MKILAVIDVVASANISDIRARLAEELRASWKLFSAGVLREAYATASATRVAFILEAETLESASEQLSTLPLIGSGLLTMHLDELRPFVNWSLLFQQK